MNELPKLYQIQTADLSTLAEIGVPEPEKWQEIVSTNTNHAQELWRAVSERNQTLGQTAPKPLTVDDLARWFSAVYHHRDQPRKSGEPYSIHLWGVAQLGVEYGFTEPELISIMLAHDVIEDSKDLDSGAPIFFDFREVTESTTTDQEVAAINQLTRSRIDSVSKPKPKNDDAYITKLLRSMLVDGRSIIVKLFDRLHNMLTIEHMSAEAQIRIATETMEIFVPIAKHLKMFKLQEALVRLSLKVLNPELLNSFDKYVDRTLSEFNQDSVTFRQDLQNALEAAIGIDGFTIEVTPHLLISKFDRVRGKSATEVTVEDLKLPAYENFATINIITKDDQANEKATAIVRRIFDGRSIVENNAHGFNRGKMIKPSHDELGKLFIRINTKAKEAQTGRGQFNGNPEIVINSAIIDEIHHTLTKAATTGESIKDILKKEFLAPKSEITIKSKGQKDIRLELNADTTIMTLLYMQGRDTSTKVFKVASTLESTWEHTKQACSLEEEIIHGYTYIIAE